MIRLTSEILEESVWQRLELLQNNIDSEPSFAQQKERAYSQWGATSRDEAFAKIREILVTMCVGVEICNYCEANEAIDIEHIFPKSYFPQKAFRWANYLLACKTCNTTHKSDNFGIFAPLGSTNSIEFNYHSHPNFQPPNEDALFINPREEDPMAFWELDFETGIFVCLSNQKNSREYKKAEYTLRILQLNERQALTKARKDAYKFFWQRLNFAIQVCNTPSVESLEQLVNQHEPHITFNPIKTLSERKSEVLLITKEDICSHSQPTVWAEMKRQRQFYSNLNRLFAQYPESLYW